MFFKYIIIIIVLLCNGNYNINFKDFETPKLITYKTAKKINDENYQLLKEAYENLGYIGGCELGDLSEYNFYRKQFKKLILGEKPLYDLEEGELLLKNYGLIPSSDLDFKDFIYLFFDIDGDNSPELCIKDNCCFIYIIKYDKYNDKFIIWNKYEMTYLSLMGTKKLRNSVTNSFDYIVLEESGEFKDKVRFTTVDRDNKETNITERYYLVTLPEKINSDIYNKLKKYLFEYNNIFYVKINESQFYELEKILEKNYFDELDKVTVSYDYLIQ